MTYRLDEQNIIEMYNAGWSANALAKLLGVNYTGITLRLKSYGIEQRTVQESQKLTCLVDPTLRDRRSKARRQYPINETFFDTITPDSAYMIGFIQADGNINLQRFRLCLTLKPADADFLTRIAQRMGAERPLIDARSPFGNGVYLGIYAQKLVTALQGWGIQSPKSHTATPHPLLLLHRDYWRGVVDGDGTVYVGSKG